MATIMQLCGGNVESHRSAPWKIINYRRLIYLVCEANCDCFYFRFEIRRDAVAIVANLYSDSDGRTFAPATLRHSTFKKSTPSALHFLQNRSTLDAALKSFSVNTRFFPAIFRSKSTQITVIEKHCIVLRQQRKLSPSFYRQTTNVTRN